MEEAYNEHLEKNRGIRDKLFIVVLFFLNVSLLTANLILREYSTAEVCLRGVSFAFLLLLFFLSRVLHSHQFVSWVFVGVFTYLLAV